jgi:hypothetical protein
LALLEAGDVKIRDVLEPFGLVLSFVARRHNQLSRESGNLLWMSYANRAAARRKNCERLKGLCIYKLENLSATDHKSLQSWPMGWPTAFNTSFYQPPQILVGVVGAVRFELTTF